MISIIGGGIGGLVLALALEKNGIDYQLYERTEAFRMVGAGIWMPPNALQVLKSIDSDVFRAILKEGNTIKRVSVTDSQFNPITDSNQDFIKRKWGFVTTAIHRGTLQQILLRYLPAKKIHLGKEFKAHSYLNETEISVSFMDGTSIITNAVIGADGLNSSVRAALFPDSGLRYSGQTSWRGISSYKLKKDFDHRGLVMWGKQVQFGLSKISKDQVYWFAVQLSKPNLKDNKSLLKDQLKNLFASFSEDVIHLIDETPIEQIIRSDLNELRLLDSWHKGNICLIGDAAHGMTPDLGQGGAQAIEDVYYLSNLLSNSEPTDEAFQMFYKLRKEKVQKIVRQSWNSGRVANLKHGIKFRNFLLKRIPNKFLEKQMLKTYSLDENVFEDF